MNIAEKIRKLRVASEILHQEACDLEREIFSLINDPSWLIPNVKKNNDENISSEDRRE